MEIVICKEQQNLIMRGGLFDLEDQEILRCGDYFIDLFIISVTALIASALVV